MPIRRATVALGLLSLVACRPGSAGEDAGPAPVASKELVKAKAPPHPHPAPPVPPLPDLPILEKQDPAQKLPFGFSLPTRGAAAGNVASRCGGQAWNGAQMVSLPCAENGLLFGRDDGGAHELVSSRLLKGNTAVLPRVVDHRFLGLEGPVRDQRSSPACTAFALAAAMDHAVARWTGKPSSVSTMEIWSRYRSPYAAKAISSNLGQAIAPESIWPFDERTAKGWVACEPGAHPKEGCGLAPDAKHVAKVASDPAVTLTDVTYLSDPDVDDLREHLAAGQDIVVSLELPAVFAPSGRTGARYVPHWTVEKPEGGHALVLAGYVTLANAVYFLMHNSWGAGWGDGGYAWIHATTLVKHLREALVVDAEPVLRDNSTKLRRTRGAFTCDAPLVPDAIRATCTPVCPDGSPRSDGVCPVPGQCAPGLVNLTGSCVVAAPTSRGTDPKTGVTWACGPGGCTYELPRRSDPDCKGNLCKASCPAPIFRVAAAGDVLTCVE